MSNSAEPMGRPQPSLVLLCKRPAPGHSKQRLAQQLGEQSALQVALGLLDCAVEDLQQWPGPKVLAPDHAQHLAWGQALCPPAQCLPQGEGNLGQRLNDLDRRLRQQGQRSLLFIGSDCPALSAADYQRVTELLAQCDTVLLMAEDGGVVLLASNRPWPDLSELPWSTAQLGAALIDCCRAAGHSLQLAGELFDIDHQEDLPALLKLLAADLRPARQQLRTVLDNLMGNAVQEGKGISVIVPCWQDEALLGPLLVQLNRLAAEAQQPVQLTVVDAASSPVCRDICLEQGAQWLPSQPCRGEQLRQGASAASYGTLWFLHADAQLRGNPLPQISAAISGGALGGYFAFGFSGSPCWQSRLLEQLIALRNRFGVPYGDQGLFVEARAYHACGQHSPWPLFEEVELVKRLRQHGRFVRLAEGVQVDPRRWQRDGWWRRSLRNRLLALGYACGIAPQRLAASYSKSRAPAARANQP